MQTGTGWLSTKRLIGCMLAVSTCLGVVGVGTPEVATAITLSDLSSDETSPWVLDATLDFSVTDSMLTITATNTSLYSISEIYFNASSDISGLTLLSATSTTDGNVLSGWSLATDPKIGAFGYFEFGLIDGVGGNTSLISPGETTTFVLSITGTGPFNVSDDFLNSSLTSTNPPGNMSVYVAAKFVNGPNGDSAYGAVPNPSPLLMLGSALAGLSALGWILRRK